MRLSQNTVAGAAISLIGCCAVIGSFLIRVEHERFWAPRVFPLISAAALILLGGLMLRPSTQKAPDLAPITHAQSTLLALLIAYLWAIGKFGYLISTAFAAPAALWIFGIRNPVALVVAAVIMPIVYHLLFFKVLGVFPPYGAWFDLLDCVTG